MKVADNMFVSIDYRLSLEGGEEVDRSPEGQPLGFITGTGRIIPGLERALMGKPVGYRGTVTVEPEDGYGPVDERLFHDLPRDRFPEGADVVPGAAFQARGPRGPVTITVSRVNADGTVTVDLNHPMAGKRLRFDVSVVEVREPSPEDLVAASEGCGCGPAGDSGCSAGSCGPQGSGSGCSCG